MLIGIPKEIKNHEYRVGLTPKCSVSELVRHGHMDDPHLRNGLNVINGKITCKEVANDLGYDYLSAEKALVG